MDGSSHRLDSVALARRYGREMAAAAYVILENRQAAERAAAGGIADFLRERGEPDEAETCLDHQLIGLSLRRALAGDGGQHEIDPLVDETVSQRLAALTGLQRAAATANLVAGASLSELGAALREPEERLQDALRAAIRLSGDRERLASIIRAQVADVSLSVTPGAIADALAGPPLQPRAPQPALLMAAGAALFLAVATWMGTSGFAPRPGEGAARVTPQPSTAPSLLDVLPGSVANGALAAGDDLQLSDCQIHPETTRLAYRGWLDVGDVAGGSALATLDRPVYALVTATPAKWVGTREASGSAPPPIARLACVVDPADGTSAVWVIPGGWQPPDVVDGCPTTDVHRYGAFEEIGGPEVFVVLPRGETSWRAGDRDLELYLRVPGTADEDARVTATAHPLGAGRPIELPVSRMSSSPPGTPSRNVYLALGPADFPREGCWAVSVALDGEPVGMAVIPVAAAT